MSLKLPFPKVQVYSEPQNMTVFGSGSLQMILDEIDRIVIGWVLSPMTFVLIRGERLKYTGRKAMWKQAGGAGGGERQPQTQKHREPLKLVDTGRILLCISGRRFGLSTPGFWTCSLHSCERLNLYCFKQFCNLCCIAIEALESCYNIYVCLGEVCLAEPYVAYL